MPGALSSDTLKASFTALQACEVIPFNSWPDARVPRAAAGVYTVWHGEQFIYVGMAGRSLDECSRGGGVFASPATIS